jgi:Exostosin family
MSIVRLYSFKPLADIEPSIFTRILEAKNAEEGNLFQKIPTAPFKEMVAFVDTASEADAVLMPHNYFRVHTDSTYLDEAVACAKEANIPLLIFTLNDDPVPIDITHSIVLRPSMYKSKARPYEQIISALVEDVGAQFGSKPRPKTSEVPSIGFSGMVQLSSWKLETRYQLRLLYNKMQAFLGIISGAEYQGLYYRRRATAVIERSKKCVANFNIRKTFSANIKTIEGNPEQMRREFVESIQDSDLSLVVRGNGNYSLRFYEVLSLGRIPIFVDTDMPLPFSDIIDYDSFMIRVDYRDIHKIPDIVETFWDNTTPEQYVAMQKKAREVFELYFRPDSFFRHFFTELKK